MKSIAIGQKVFIEYPENGGVIMHAILFNGRPVLSDGGFGAALSASDCPELVVLREGELFDVKGETLMVFLDEESGMPGSCVAPRSMYFR